MTDDDDDGGDDDGEGDDDDDDDDGEDDSDDDGEDDDDNDYGEDDEYVYVRTYVRKLLSQPPRKCFPFPCRIKRQCEQLIRKERNWNLHESSRQVGRTLAVTALTRCPTSR